MAFDPVWEEVFKTQSWGQYPSEELIRFVARNYYRVPDRGAVRILDVGCGPGANLWYLAREGFAVYGVDGSVAAIAQARIRLDRECPGWKGELKAGDIVNLEFENDVFDAVIDSEAIYANAFDDAVKIYAELARVCKRGGKLFSRTFASGCWGEGTGRRVGHNAWIAAEGPLHKKGLSRFTRLDEIHGLVKGFKVDEVELVTRTLDNRVHEIREWLIVGEKV